MFDPSFNAGFTAVLLSDSKPLESAEASTFFMQSCLRALPPTGVDPNNSAPDADVHLGVHSPESPFCSSPGGLSHPVVCSSTICFVLTTVSHSLTLCRAEKAKSISVQWSGPPWISVSQVGLREVTLVDQNWSVWGLYHYLPGFHLLFLPSPRGAPFMRLAGVRVGCRETRSRVPETHQHTWGSTGLTPGFPQSLPRAAGRAAEPLRQCWGKGGTCIALTQSQKWWAPGMTQERGPWGGQGRGCKAGEVQDTRRGPQKSLGWGWQPGPRDEPRAQTGCGDSCPEGLSRGALGVGRACPNPEGNGNSCSSCPEKKKERKLSPGLSTLLGDVRWGGKGRGLRIRRFGHISALPLANCEALSQ